MVCDSRCSGIFSKNVNYTSLESTFIKLIVRIKVPNFLIILAIMEIKINSSLYLPHCGGTGFDFRPGQ